MTLENSKFDSFTKVVVPSNALHAKTTAEGSSMFDIKNLATLSLSRNAVN